MARIEALETLASELIGDGQEPDLFFVTDRGNVCLLSVDGEQAYEAWLSLARRLPLTECSLESRTIGVLCTVEPEEDNSPHLVCWDDYHRSTC